MRERRQVMSPESFGGGGGGGGGGGAGGGTPIFQPGQGGGLRGGGGAAKATNGPPSPSPATPPDRAMGGSGGAVEADPVEVKPKIRAFGQAMEAGHHSKEWRRPTNTDGTGATHVKSFHCKLAADALSYLDEQVNEWLDTHPDYEVKLVTTSIGEWTGKVREPHLIVQVWV